MKKHLLTLSTILLLLFGLSMTSYAADAPSTTTIDGETYYQIATADDLYWFANEVNSGELEINAVLTADIVVNEGVMTADSTDARVWTPISYSVMEGGSLPYWGTFDGNGHSISGVYCVGKDDMLEVGLFALIGDDGVIKNLSVENSYFKGVNYVGSIAGYNYGVISACKSNSTVDAKGRIMGDSVVGIGGGIVGGNFYEVVGSTFSGTVSGNLFVGGIAGDNSMPGSIKECTNTGAVIGYDNEDSYIGGIVGLNRGLVASCGNVGTLSSECSAIGGIAGENQNEAGMPEGGRIVNCFSHDDITGSNEMIGGLVGYNHHNGTVCYCIFEDDGKIARTVGVNLAGVHDIVTMGSEVCASGEAAYVLQGGCTVGEGSEAVTYPGTAWGQDLDNGKPVQATPHINGAKVSYCYIDEAQQQMGYTNKPYHKSSGFAKQEDKYFADECSNCGEALRDATRISGKNRSLTALAAADVLKGELGVRWFKNIIIASGSNFADALAGSYLAAVKDAPILLYTKGGAEANVQYILENLINGGTVYILGGTGAVPESVEEALEPQGITVKRLSGKDRFATNIAILQEAGVAPGTKVLVCTGYNFADSLAASAAGLPILLVNTKKDALTADQQLYLHSLSAEAGMELTIIGGTGAVSDKLMNKLSDYGTIGRLKGADRYATSVAIAEEFFRNPDTVCVAYGKNFPDGLCGGPLAYAMGAPLLLVQDGKEAAASDYAAENEVVHGYILGGDGVISDKSVVKIFK